MVCGGGGGVLGGGTVVPESLCFFNHSTIQQYRLMLNVFLILNKSLSELTVLFIFSSQLSFFNAIKIIQLFHQRNSYICILRYQRGGYSECFSNNVNLRNCSLYQTQGLLNHCMYLMAKTRDIIHKIINLLQTRNAKIEITDHHRS